MSYMLIAGVIAAAGLIWLMRKSRELTAAKSKLGKQRAAARAQFLRGDAVAPQGAASSRPKFGQR